MNETLRKLHEMVWEFRHRNEVYFKTPSTLFCLYFAVTEFSEALDAWIRSHDTSFNRAREKNLNVKYETMQAILMLLTALEPADWMHIHTVKDTANFITLAITTAAGAANRFEQGRDDWQVAAVGALFVAYQIVGEGHVELMRKVLDDLYEKRVKPKANAPGGYGW